MAIKIAHTTIWGFIAGCIVGLPVAGALRRFDVAAGMAGLVLLECLALALNRGRCPLTAIAARFSEDHPLGFDIYLPQPLLDRHKMIFGTLFVVSGLAVAAEWWFLRSGQ